MRKLVFALVAMLTLSLTATTATGFDPHAGEYEIRSVTAGQNVVKVTVATPRDGDTSVVTFGDEVGKIDWQYYVRNTGGEVTVTHRVDVPSDDVLVVGLSQSRRINWHTRALDPIDVKLVQTPVW